MQNRQINKILKRHPRLPLLLVTLVVLVLGYFVLQWMNKTYFEKNVTLAPVIKRGDTMHDQPTPSPTTSSRPATASPSATPVAGSPTPAGQKKPILQKSSGNAPGSSVPAGAAMEFTCEGTADAQCEVVLTDRNNAAHQISLGAKAIASNGRGQYFAIWTWTAVSGSWGVMAKSSGGGATVASDSQTLEVR